MEEEEEGLLEQQEEERREEEEEEENEKESEEVLREREDDVVRNKISMKHLDMRSKVMGESGRKVLRRLTLLLHFNCTIRYIDLSANAITDDGAVVLAGYLRSGKCNLRRLNLSTNEIGPVGGVAIAEALRENTTILDLELQGNRLGNTGAAALASMLHQNFFIQGCTIYGNRIDDQSITSEIARLVNENKTKHSQIVFTNTELLNDRPYTRQITAYRSLTFIDLTEQEQLDSVFASNQPEACRVEYLTINGTAFSRGLLPSYLTRLKHLKVIRLYACGLDRL